MGRSGFEAGLQERNRVKKGRRTPRTEEDVAS
jgi:hypothetical protein